MKIKTIQHILATAKVHGWVMEPEAKKLLAAAYLPVPRFRVFEHKEQAIDFATNLGFPVVAKIVSPAIVHKSEVDGVEPGIRDRAQLSAVFDRFARHPDFAGILVEEMLSGIEMIIGGKIDPQFGPVVLLGLGGVAVEIYKDTSIMMAPTSKQDVETMLTKLQGAPLLFGFRGQAAINTQSLIELMVAFSKLLVKISAYVDSVDLNPVMCSPLGCIVADARIMLRA